MDREKYECLGNIGEKLIDLVELCLEVNIEERANIKDITKMFADEFLEYTIHLKLLMKEVLNSKNKTRILSSLSNN